MAFCDFSDRCLTNIYKDRDPLTGGDRDIFGWLTLNNCSITSCQTLYQLGGGPNKIAKCRWCVFSFNYV